MKHHLSSFRRSPWLRIALIVILGLMFAPVGVMAATSSVATPLASVGGFNPVMIGALGVGAMCIGLRKEASEEGDGGGGGDGQKAEDKLDLTAAIAKLEDKTLPISQRLSVAVQALKGIDPTQQLAGVQKQLTDAKASIALKDGEIAKLKAELDTAQKTLSAREKDVTDLEAANARLETEVKDLRAKEQDIDKRAGQKSKEHVASLGFPAAKLPGPTGEKGNETPAQRALAAFQAETDTEKKGQLWQEYRREEAKAKAAMN